MRNNRQNINFYIKIIYEDKEHQLLVSFSSNVKQLRQIIITYFKLNQTLYDIYYKDQRLNNNDIRPLSLLFDKDSKPLLFILEKKKSILPKSKLQTSLTLFTRMTEIKLNEILTNFFKYKNLENDANIKRTMKNMYIVHFTKPSLCADFQEFYDSQLRMEEDEEETKDNQLSSSSKTSKFKTATNPKSKLILPKINSNYNYKKDEIHKINNNKYSGLYDRKKALSKVILNNSKSDLISEKCIRTGKYRMHHSASDTTENNNNNNKNKKKISLRSKFNNYKGIYKFPYMALEERYYREKYLDKKNWINKNGFIPCGGKNNNNYNIIPNYVNATPSESPLLFKFRNVSKNKWINPKGFH